MLPHWALVAIGGAAGAALRYGVSLWALAAFGPGWPWGTLLVNVAGGFAMGALAALAGEDRALMALLGVGLLGGFTTFSAFSLETLRMLERGALVSACAYMIGTAALAVLACLAGFAAARALT